MNSLLRAGKNWCLEIASGWNGFWFTPSDPHTLSLMRIFAGAMLFYTHLVWSKDLMAFLGPTSWIPREASIELHQGTYVWSHLWYIDSPGVLWAQHLLVLIVMAMFTVGFFSRVTSVLTCLFAISYCHRLEGALFGLDQVNVMLAMYLMIGPCGAVYSVDRWLAKRKAGGQPSPPRATTSGNIAIRLIQVHMCIIYLFGGISKMRGEMWWDGTAVWYAISNLEYQSLDITWLVQLSVVNRIAQPHHSLLGSFLLLSRLAACNAPHRTRNRCVRSRWHCLISGNDHIWHGDDHRQYGLPLTRPSRESNALFLSTTIGPLRAPNAASRAVGRRKRTA